MHHHNHIKSFLMHHYRKLIANGAAWALTMPVVHQLYTR